MKSRIAVLDDNADCRTLVRLALEQDYEVEEFGDLEGLKQALLEHSVDLVLSDLNLEGQNEGYRLLEFIQHLPADSQVPVIVVTGDGIYTDRKSALESGFRGYLLKPFEFDQLLSAVQEALNDRSKASGIAKVA